MQALRRGPGLTYSEALSYTQWLAAEHDSPHQRVRGRGHCCHRDPVYYLTRTKILESIGGYSGVQWGGKKITSTDAAERDSPHQRVRGRGQCCHGALPRRLRLRCRQHLALVHVRFTCFTQASYTLLSTPGPRTRTHHLALIHVRFTCFTAGFVCAGVNTWPSHTYAMPRRHAASAAALTTPLLQH